MPITMPVEKKQRRIFDELPSGLDRPFTTGGNLPPNLAAPSTNIYSPFATSPQPSPYEGKVIHGGEGQPLYAIRGGTKYMLRGGDVWARAQAFGGAPQQVDPSILGSFAESPLDISTPGGLQAIEQQEQQKRWQQERGWIEQEYGGMMQPAMQSLEAYAQQLRQGGQLTEQQISQELQRRLREIQEGQAETVGGLERERGVATEQARMAEESLRRGEEKGVSQQRRMLNEIMQGLQARFGGATGTGAFGGEVAGRGAAEAIAGIRGQVLEAIQQNQAGLRQTLDRIGEQVTNVQREATRLSDQAGQQAEEMKERTRQELNERIAQINVQKGQLESTRAQLKMEALREARDRIAQIEAQSREFQQRLKEQQQAQENNLNMMRQQAETQFQYDIQRMVAEQAMIQPTQFMTPEQALQMGQVTGPYEILTPGGGGGGTADINKYFADLFGGLGGGLGGEGAGGAGIDYDQLAAIISGQWPAGQTPSTTQPTGGGGQYIPAGPPINPQTGLPEGTESRPTQLAPVGTRSPGGQWEVRQFPGKEPRWVWIGSQVPTPTPTPVPTP